MAIMANYERSKHYMLWVQQREQRVRASSSAASLPGYRGDREGGGEGETLTYTHPSEVRQFSRKPYFSKPALFPEGILYGKPYILSIQGRATMLTSGVKTLLREYRALPGAHPGPGQAAIYCESDKQAALGRARVQFGSSPTCAGGSLVRETAQNKENGLNG